MRLMKRNCENIYYVLFTSFSSHTDTDGYEDGTHTQTYSSVSSVSVSLSGESGKAELNGYGINTPYTRRMVTDDMSCAIDEASRLWIGYGDILEFSQSRSYAVGDLVIYNGVIYRCTASASAGAWDSTKFSEEPCNYLVNRVSKGKNAISYDLIRA